MKINRGSFWSINSVSICLYAFLCICLWVGFDPAYADFVVQSEYQSSEPYGNAQLPCFRGGRPLSTLEEDELARILPLKEVGRFYGRFSVGVGPYTYSAITNKTIGTATNLDLNGAVVVNSVQRSQVGLEFAVGYVWSKSMRGEIEYLVNRDLTYNANPILTGPNVTARSLSATITNNTFLANLYYDFVFAGYDRFRPFIVGGIGVAVNSVQATISPATISGVPGQVYAQAQKTRQTGSFAWDAGVGFRFSFFTRWFFNFSVRYIFLGTPTVQLGNSPNIFKIRGNYSYVPISFGVSYIF